MDERKKATFAGGCFWCMEHPFRELEGVTDVKSGYSGGDEETANYEAVSTGTTDHYEAVQVTYDPAKISYDELLKTFWINVDPTDDGGQFVDRGDQYKTAIFVHDDEQRSRAEASKKELESSGRFKKPIATKILPYESFYEAEDYHQNYAETQSFRYRMYRAGSGRDAFLGEHWSG